MTDSARDDEAAQRIAAWLRNKSTDNRTWYEIRTLMQEFELDRFTADARNQISSALTRAGIDIEPDLHTCERRDTVVLSWPANHPEARATARSSDPTPVAECVTVRTAGPDGVVRVIPFGEAANQPAAVVRWVDVHKPAGLASREALTALAPVCAGITEEMLDDLISPDPRPKVRPFDNGRIRLLSSFRVEAVESDDGAAPDNHSKAGVLVFEPVEILAGPGWVMTCWHETQKFRGALRIEELPPAPPEEIYAAVERAWTSAYSSSGDLAVLLQLELSMSYKPACRQLRVWEEEWELDYFRTDHAYDDTLVEAQAGLAVLRDWLSPLNISGMRQDIDRAWFPGISGDASAGGHERALRVDDRVDQSLKELAEVGKLIRDAYELLEVRRVTKAQERDARFQRTIAIGGSAILIPTLVAGVMGMNTWVPGEDGPDPAKWAFALLLLVMVLSALAAWYTLKRIHDHNR